MYPSKIRYFFYLSISVILFACISMILSLIFSNYLSDVPKDIKFIAVTLSFVFTAFIFALFVKCKGIFNGVIFGVFATIVLLWQKIPNQYALKGLLSSPYIDGGILLLISFTFGITLSAIGGGIYDISKLLKRKFSNNSLKQ